jgi:hypothetical protein
VTDERRLYLVTGSPRSGTSLVAGLLQTNGIPMGRKMSHERRDDDPNPAGFFEDLDFADKNELFIRAAGGHDLDPPPVASLARVNARSGFQFQLANLINLRVNRFVVWGLKDPRLVLLWDFYRPLIVKEMGPRLIVCHRNPLGVARSLVAYGRAEDEGQGFYTVNLYERRLAVICESVDWPVLHVAFEDWWRFPERQRGALDGFVGRELDYSHFDEGLWRA